MHKQSTIKQCILICQPLASDFDSSNCFHKIGSVPVLDICISWLIDNGIREIQMYCSKNKEAITDYIANFNAVNGGSSGGHGSVLLECCFVKVGDLRSFGDVMREVQFRNKVSSDFIIMYADTITNINLHKLISSHFKKKHQLKSVVLTTVARPSSSSNKIHITNPQTGQILQMQQQKQKQGQGQSQNQPLSLSSSTNLNTNNNSNNNNNNSNNAGKSASNKFILNSQRINLKKMNVEIRRDLAHCDLYLCTVDVFKSFKQNYEYAVMYDFINGMLTSQVYQQKIIAYILDNNEQCYRTNKTKDYYLAHMNYISHNFHPYTLSSSIPSYVSPSLHHHSSKGKYITKNFNKVIFNGVTIPRGVYISNNCYIGEGTVVGEEVQLERTVIGAGCHIGRGAVLRACIILEGCSIGQKSRFQNCLIQKVNQTQQIRRFSFPTPQTTLISQSLFEQTPPPEQNTFEQQLQQLLEQQPEIEMVGELNAIRYHHNKSLNQFIKEMIRLLNPQGVKGVESVVREWGPVMLKINDKENLMIESLYYACANIPAYEKAFHVFLQYFYSMNIINDYTILKWYEQATAKYPNSPAIQKCQNFIAKLKEKDEEQSEEEGSQKDSGNDSDEGKEGSSSSDGKGRDGGDEEDQE